MAVLPSAPIASFEEYADPKAGDYLPIVEIATGKTKKIKAQYFGQTAPSTNYKWVSGFDYPEDAIVDYNGQWYLSLQTPNLGKTPNAQPLYWELQTKAAQGFVFWGAGVYTGDPVLVMYEIGAGNVQIYRLIDATRPFLSADFEAELAGGDWEIISGGTPTSFKGVFANEAALEAAFPAAEPGDYAYVDAGAASPVEMWIWDDDDSEWIQSGTPAGGTWGSITGTLSSQTDLQAALDAKTDQLTTFRRLTASHTLDATDLVAINAGDDVVIEMNVASANDLTVPLNATQAFPIGTKLTIIQYGAGLTSIVATGGVTIHTSSGDFISRNQFAPMLLEKVATDEWYLSNGTTPGSIVSSGTWTPTLTNTTNIAASTAYACQYMRVGNTVTVSGKVSIDATAAGDTLLGMSIPIASAFSQEYHAGGVAASHAVQQSAAIYADATNDRLTLRLTITDTTNRDWFFTATYQII